MQIEDVRPLIAGVVGGLIAMALQGIWSKSMRAALNGRSAESLRSQYRLAIRLSDLAGAAGIVGGLAMYMGGFASNDWRPLGLGLGVAFSAPLLVLPATAAWCGGVPMEAFAAYAFAKKTPPVYLYAICALGLPLLAVTAVYW